MTSGRRPGFYSRKMALSGSLHALAALIPDITRHPLYRRMDWPESEFEEGGGGGGGGGGIPNPVGNRNPVVPVAANHVVRPINDLLRPNDYIRPVV